MLRTTIGIHLILLMILEKDSSVITKKESGIPRRMFQRLMNTSSSIPDKAYRSCAKKRVFLKEYPLSFLWYMRTPNIDANAPIA